MGQKIIVTGGNGFIGYNLCHFFDQIQQEVISIDRMHYSKTTQELDRWEKINLSLPTNEFIQLLKDFAPDIIIHCAGAADVAYSTKQPYMDFKSNVEICQFILNAIKETNTRCKFILLSSAAVYGDPKHIPVKEREEYNPISPYGYHKMMCEQTVQMYSKLYGIKSAVLRIFSAYGDNLKKQVIFDLCTKAIDINNKEIIVFGTGDETRDFIHIDDITHAIDCIIRNNSEGIYNVASGIQTPIKRVVELIVKNMNCKKKIVFTGNTREGDPLLWQADISKISSLGFKQRINLEQGIEQYCKWFLNNI